MSQGRWSRHRELNEIIKGAFSSAGVPSKLEPLGLFHDNKRGDGVTLVPWSKGRCLVWDATCSDTLAKTYLPATSRTAGAATQAAELRKHNLCASLSGLYRLCPFAVETLGPFGEEARDLVKELGRRIHTLSGEPRSHSFLVQRISIAIQRGNAAAVLGSIPSSPNLEDIVPVSLL